MPFVVNLVSIQLQSGSYISIQKLSKHSHSTLLQIGNFACVCSKSLLRDISSPNLGQFLDAAQGKVVTIMIAVRFGPTERAIKHVNMWCHCLMSCQSIMYHVLSCSVRNNKNPSYSL